MNKNELTRKVKVMVGGFGCAGIILAVVIILLLIVPAILLLGGMVWGCIVYALWNWVVVPVAGLPALTYWWQCVIVGVFLRMVTGVLRSSSKRVE